METYLDDATYAELVAALMKAPRVDLLGREDADAIKLALGEIGDVWPIRIKEPSDDNSGATS